MRQDTRILVLISIIGGSAAGFTARIVGLPGWLALMIMIMVGLGVGGIFLTLTGQWEDFKSKVNAKIPLKEYYYIRRVLFIVSLLMAVCASVGISLYNPGTNPLLIVTFGLSFLILVFPLLLVVFMLTPNMPSLIQKWADHRPQYFLVFIVTILGLIIGLELWYVMIRWGMSNFLSITIACLFGLCVVGGGLTILYGRRK